MDKIRLWPEIVDLDELAASGSQTFPVAEYKGAEVVVTVSRPEEAKEVGKYDLLVENPGVWQYRDSCGATREELDAALKNLTGSLTEENFFMPGRVADGMPEREALAGPSRNDTHAAPKVGVIDVPTVDHLIGNARFREALDKLSDQMLPGESTRWAAGELELEIIRDEQGLIVSNHGHDLTEKDLDSLAVTKEESVRFMDFVAKMRGDMQRAAEEPGRTPSDRDPGDRGERMPERTIGAIRIVGMRAPEAGPGEGEALPAPHDRSAKKELSPDEIRRREEEERRRREKQRKRAHALTKVSTHTVNRAVYRAYELAENADREGDGSARYDDRREREDILIQEAEIELG